MPKRSKSKGFTTTVEYTNPEAVRRLLGVHDENVSLLESIFAVEIGARGGKIKLSGKKDEVESAKKVLDQMYELAKEGYPLSLKDVEQISKFADAEGGEKMSDLLREGIKVPAQGKLVSPRTPGQKRYVKSIEDHDMVFSIGPAGTGKTYLAMAMAVNSLMKEEYERIILTRPAVEAGEKLGFLPGDMQEKVNPYLRPLYDALHDMMDLEQVRRSLDQGVIEVAPLAFMRGRTLNSAFVVLDEAQNCTPEQMKMFLTRMGFDSKMVITGDITQIDLPAHTNSGLLEARRILSHIPGISFHYLTDVDVVRHKLVQEIVKAYERHGVDREKANSR